MHGEHLDDWKHDHTFGQDRVSKGERRTLGVALLTAVFMVVEIAAGIVYGSMALLADGLHMGSHAVALGIAVAAYVYARRRAGDARFSFGTGKVNALGGHTGAVLLAGFAVVMAWESFERFLSPVPIGFDQAIAVAVVGLIVNGISVAVLGVHGGHEHGHAHDHGHARAQPSEAPADHAENDHAHEHAHDPEHAHECGQGHAEHAHDPEHAEHEHAHDHAAHEHTEHAHEHADDSEHAHEHADDSEHAHEHADDSEHAHDSEHEHAHEHAGDGEEAKAPTQDHNLRSAYLHVLADALTSLTAIFALLGGKFFGLQWLDPAMGIVGALLVARWSVGLIRQSSAVLLDHQAPEEVRARVRAAVEVGEDRVVDLHVWSIGPGVHAGLISLVSHDAPSPDEVKARLPGGLLQHVTVEIHRCDPAGAPPRK